MRERAIFTIPNLLSAFRLLLAGLIAGLYRAGDVPGAAQCQKDKVILNHPS